MGRGWPGCVGNRAARGSSCFCLYFAPSLGSDFVGDLSPVGSSLYVGLSPPPPRTGFFTSYTLRMGKNKDFKYFSKSV